MAKTGLRVDLTHVPDHRPVAAICALSSPTVSAANVRFPANAAHLRLRRLGLTLIVRWSGERQDSVQREQCAEMLRASDGTLRGAGAALAGWLRAWP